LIALAESCRQFAIVPNWGEARSFCIKIQTMTARIFLALTGLMYIGLAAWCTISPEKTSDKVGFQMKPGSGQSEFIVIYGGLELAMGILFLLPLWKPEWLQYSLFACIVIHGCLVAFRTASYLMYSGISGTTNKLAIGEWVILLAAIAVYAFTFLRSHSPEAG
jgi:hypothetical protein